MSTAREMLEQTSEEARDNLGQWKPAVDRLADALLAAVVDLHREFVVSSGEQPSRSAVNEVIRLARAAGEVGTDG